MFCNIGWTLLRAEGLFCNLDVLYWGLGIDKLKFLIQKKFIFFFSCNFSNFWSLKPRIRIGSGSGSVFSLKCWIRIRMKWMRIRNPGSNLDLDPDLRKGKCSGPRFREMSIGNTAIKIWRLGWLTFGKDLAKSGIKPVHFCFRWRPLCLGT